MREEKRDTVVAGLGIGPLPFRITRR